MNKYEWFSHETRKFSKLINLLDRKKQWGKWLDYKNKKGKMCFEAHCRIWLIWNEDENQITVK
jgi:hypothetical protein